MAQSVKRLTLDFRSGHDLTVREFEPHVRLPADSTSTEPAGDSLSPSLSSPPPLSLSLKINKLKKRLTLKHEFEGYKPIL